MSRYYVYQEDGELMRFRSKNELLEYALGGWNTDLYTYPATTKKEALRLAYEQFDGSEYHTEWAWSPQK